LHRQCLSGLGLLQRENYNHPSSEGTFLIPTLNQRQFIGRVARGIAPPGSHRSRRDSLPSMPNSE